jgi:phosphate transport system ATP-binding protein
MMEATNSQSAELKNALEIKDLQFFYGSFQGLKNINLKLQTRFNTPSYYSPAVQNMPQI